MLERVRTNRAVTVVVAVAGALFALSAGCRRSSSSVRLKVCGDAHVPGQIDALRLRLLDDERQTRREGIVELLECPQATVRNLPESVSFRSIDGDAWAVVQALKAGRVVGRFEKRVELDGGGGTTVRLAMNRDCLGVSCPTGQTCIGGACELARFHAKTSTVCESTNSGGTLGDVGPMARTDVGLGETDPERICARGDAGSTGDAGDSGSGNVEGGDSDG